MSKLKEYKLPRPKFDAYNPEAGVMSALGSDRVRTVKEVSEYKSNNFETGVSGWRLTPDNAELNVATAIQSLNIPDTVTANSFHVDSEGNTWWGATTLGSAIAKVLKTGIATFTNIVITGSSTQIQAPLVKEYTAGENLTAGDACILGEFYTSDLESSSSQYFSATDSVSLSITGDLTISCWTKLESSPGNNEGRYFVSKHNTGGSAFAYSFNYSNVAGTYKLRLQIGSGGSQATVTVDKTLTEGTWYYVAVVYTASGGTADFYVDGVQTGTQQSGLGTSIGDNTSDLTIGTSSPFGADQFFDGKIKDVRLWAEARSSSEIAADFDTELNGTETNLKAYWKLDNSLTDSTANANTLTNNASATFVIDTAAGLMNSASSPKLYKTDASFRSTSQGFAGFVKTTTTSGDSCPVVISGEVTGLSSIITGSRGLYYLSDTRGAISNTAGTISRKVAQGTSSTTVNVTNIW